MKITETSTVHLSYYSDRIIVSKERLIHGSACIKKKEIMLKNRSTVYNGFMSPSTKRKVRTILTTWFNAISFHNEQKKISLVEKKKRLVFITVTLSDVQKHDDKWIKRNMLDRYLVKLKRKYGVTYFLWKAEKQKNGRIHFHIIVDSYISKEDVQMEWNSIQQEVGYLDRFFFEKKRYNAPSTDIRSVNDMDNAVEYVMKYMAKPPEDMEDATLQVQGRIWGCSKELKALKPYSSGEVTEIGVELNEAAAAGKIKYFDHEHFQVFYLDVDFFLKNAHPRVYEQMSSYYKRVYERLYLLSNFERAISQHIDDVREEGGAKAVQLSLFAESLLDSDSSQRARERKAH